MEKREETRKVMQIGSLWTAYEKESKIVKLRMAIY
jgi:hypothetical protein